MKLLIRHNAMIFGSCLLGLCLMVCPAFLPRGVSATDNDSKSIRFTMTGLKDGQKVREHDLGIIRFEVRFEYPRIPARPLLRFDPQKLDVCIDGQPAEYRHAASSGGSDEDVVYRMHRISIQPGAPGVKRITVKYDSMQTGVSIDWQPEGQLEIQDLVDQQAIFDDAPLPVRWFGAHLDPKSITLKVNGKAGPVGIAEGFSPQHCSGTLETIPGFGVSIIELAARDLKGNPIVATRTVYSYPDKTMPSGTIFALPLGPVGSRSGPFFRARAAGSSLHEIRSNEDYPSSSKPVLQQFVHDELVVRRRPLVLAWFRSVSAGHALIRIEKKGHFLDEEWELLKNIELVVTKP